MIFQILHKKSSEFSENNTNITLCNKHYQKTIVKKLFNYLVFLSIYQSKNYYFNLKKINCSKGLMKKRVAEKFRVDFERKQLQNIFENWKSYHKKWKTQEMMNYTAKFLHQKKLFKSIFNAFRKYLFKKVNK